MSNSAENIAISTRRSTQALSGDTLHLIFLHSGPSRICDDNPDISSVFPMNLALVCRSWNAIVKERPSLWGIFDVDMKTNHPVNRCLGLLIETWLRNSSSSPLNFRVRITAHDSSKDVVLERIASRLLSQTHRWKNVEFNIRSTPLTPHLREIQLPTISSLTSLWIGLSEHFNEYGLAEKAVVSIDLSRSRHLRIMGLRFGVKMRLLGQQPIHLDGLTHLSLSVDASTFEDFRRVLTSSVNLAYLNLAFSNETYYEHQEYYPEEPISLADLRKVALVYENRALMARFFGCITCPSLQSIVVDKTDFMGVREPPEVYETTLQLIRALDSFLDRSRPPLNILILDWSVKIMEIPTSLREEYSRMLRLILGKLDDLEILSIIGFVVDDQLLREMTFREDETGVVCPLLIRLAITGYDYNVSLRTLADLAVSRWRFGPALNYLQLDIWGSLRSVPVSKKDELMQEFPEVKRCIEEGLILTC